MTVKCFLIDFFLFNLTIFIQIIFYICKEKSKQVRKSKKLISQMSSLTLVNKTCCFQLFRITLIHFLCSAMCERFIDWYSLGCFAFLSISASSCLMKHAFHSPNSSIKVFFLISLMDFFIHIFFYLKNGSIESEMEKFHN